MSTALDTRAHLGALVTSAAALGRVLERAHVVEWDRSPNRAPVDRDTDRSRHIVGGPPSDPTADFALDPRRLRLRATVASADRALEAAAWWAEAARRDLTASLGDFLGDPEAAA